MAIFYLINAATAWYWPWALHRQVPRGFMAGRVWGSRCTPIFVVFPCWRGGWQVRFFWGGRQKFRFFEWQKFGSFWRARGWVQCAAAAARWQHGAGRRRACPIGRGAMLRRPLSAAGLLLPAFVPLSLPSLGSLIPWNKTQTPSRAHSPRQGRGKLPGTAHRQGRQPAHPGAPSPVVDGLAQKSIHKIPHMGERRWCRGEVPGVNHNSGVEFQNLARLFRKK